MKLFTVRRVKDGISSAKPNTLCQL